MTASTPRSKRVSVMFGSAYDSVCACQRLRSHLKVVKSWKILFACCSVFRKREITLGCVGKLFGVQRCGMKVLDPEAHSFGGFLVFSDFFPGQRSCQVGPLGVAALLPDSAVPLIVCGLFGVVFGAHHHSKGGSTQAQLGGVGLAEPEQLPACSFALVSRAQQHLTDIKHV